MAAVNAARTVIGVIGNISSFFLFASPILTVVRIVKNKSVEEFTPDPYIAAVMNCISWVYYALPFIHPDSMLVLSINSVGLALELGYLVIFFIYTNNNKQRLKIIVCLGIEAVITGVIAAISLTKFHTHASRSVFVGIFSVIFGVILYSSPLTVMRKVIQTKSVEFMPFWLSVAAFSNGLIWTIYASLKFDPFIMAGNALGAFLGVAQLILYWYYHKSTPKADQKKPSEVQLPEM